MLRYCLGFCFNEDKSHVLLILKSKPTWQAGNWNGIGGKVEKNETTYIAMCREFKEETTVELTNWKPTLTMGNFSWKIDVFYNYLPNNKLKQIEAATKDFEERCKVFSIDLLPDNCIDNLAWLIPYNLNVPVYNIKQTNTSCLGKL